nr:MAG TPA: virion structural protein [Caudoviricetes sp.]
MARTQGTLLSGTTAYAGLSFAPTIDLRHGGQNGYISDYRTFISNSSYVQRNLIAFLVEYPRGFEHMGPPNSGIADIYIGTLKALVEQHAKTIEGLNGTIEVEYQDTQVGAAGEVQSDPSRVTRAPSQPVFTWTEKQGRSVQLFFEAWIYYLIMHPDTQTPAISSLPWNKGKNFDYLPDFNSMAVLFVEPDPFQQRVMDAYLCVGMMPKGAGDKNGRRDISAGGNTRDITITFTALTMQSLGVNQFAQSVLDELNYVGLNPHTRRSAIETISSFIRDVKDGNLENIGYTHQVEEVGTTQNYNYGENRYPDYATRSQPEKRGPNGLPQHNPVWTNQQGTRGAPLGAQVTNS